MIKRTIEISSDGNRLSVKNDQLVIERDREVVGTVPCEDIGILILDSKASLYTHDALIRPVEHGAVVVLCGADHHPAAMMLPTAGNDVQTQRLRAQTEVKKPLLKQLWRQVVQAKIRGQARALPPDHPARNKLNALAHEVRSGDPANVEAQASKLYWSALFPNSSSSPTHGEPVQPSPLPKCEPTEPSPLPKGGPQGGSFRRARDGPPPNNLLNYGYMALRAATARAACGAGLHPSLGISHHNKYNPFCLADDLMEPYRPFVDSRVAELVRRGIIEINGSTKRFLLETLTDTVTLDAQTGPLLVALHRTAASLVRCYLGQDKNLLLP